MRRISNWVKPILITLTITLLILPRPASGAEAAYTYDLVGNRATMTDPTGVTHYEYDALNRLTKITNPPNQVITYEYDAIGKRTKMTYPNNMIAGYTYDAGNRLTGLAYQLNGTTIAGFAYTYDSVGNRLSMTDEYGTHNYGYDNKYQLISATHPNQPPEIYSYDTVGNRLGNTYNAANQLLEDANYTYLYARNGNTTQKVSKSSGEVTKYIWNAENQLIKIEKFHSVADADPYSGAGYIYDGMGRRVAKIVDNVVTKYVYDNEDILLELDEDDNVLVRYTHGPGIDEPLIMERGGQSYYYVTDGLGSVVKIVDAAGNVVNGYVYDSFGKIVSKTETVPNFYTYTAREFDSESGLYYYRARYYEAKIGRFLSEDPIEFLGGVNFYTYTDNAPINFSDPYGLITIPFIDLWIPVGECAGEEAAEYWAKKYVKTGNWLYNIPGLFAALWTRETSDISLWTLASAYSSARWASKTGPWAGKITIHPAHGGGPHQYPHIQIMIRTAKHVTRHLRIPLGF